MTNALQDSRFSVPADDYMQVVDLVNRLNYAFDVWDVETMVGMFTEDVVIQHARGDVEGRDALRSFYEDYRPLTLGVRRHAVNHVVDGLSDGTIRVTSYNLLIRVAPVSDSGLTERQMVSEFDIYPAIYVHAVMIDTFRKDPHVGWRICHRSAAQNSLNRTLRH